MLAFTDLMLILPCLLVLCHFAYSISHLACTTCRVSCEYPIVWLHICSSLCRLPALMYTVVTRLVNDIMKCTTTVQTRYYFTWHAKKLTQSFISPWQWYYLVTMYIPIRLCWWQKHVDMNIVIKFWFLSIGICHVCVHYNGVLQAGRYGPCFKTETSI